MGDFSRWACGNKRCGFQHNYASRSSCYKCGWQPGRLPGLSAPRQAAPKPRGAWVQGPPRSPQKPAAPPLTDAQVAAYARMSEEDFAAVAGD
eukprot:9107215-Pyramimonas_sp.AAC.1